MLEENSKFLQPTSGQLDSPNFPLLQSELTPCMNSPFACDFGNDDNGLQFLDGTSEQDFSLSELLDEVFHNHDDCSCEESTNVKNSVDGTGVHLSHHTCLVQNNPPLPIHHKYLTGACNPEVAQVVF